MAKRSPKANTETDAEALTLKELNERIAWLEYRAKAPLSASLRKSAMKSLVRLEEQRERIHGVPAPRRRRF